MKQPEKTAERVASELRRAPEWGGRVRHRSGDVFVQIEDAGDLEDALLELRPAADVDEVPVWVDFEHGRADLSEIEFEPVSVSVVRWGKEHGERGLIADFPQMLLGPALAGRRHANPVAGGRRADGSLELWIEATAAGEVLAAVDADARLGDLAELRLRTGRDEERLVVALAATTTGRNAGLFRVPMDPGETLAAFELLLHARLSDLGADPDLLARSAGAARSEPCRKRWRELLREDPRRGRAAARR